MLLVGKVIGRGVAGTASGSMIPYRLVVPDKRADNLDWLAKESQRWRVTEKRFKELVCMGQLSPDVVRRAGFAQEVMTVVANNIRVGVCCYIIVQGYDERVLGLVTYAFILSTEGVLNLQAIDPEQMAGTPGIQQLRGIGTAMLAAVANEFLKTGRTTLFLHALDEQAAIFWSRRGFVMCGAGGLMCVRTRQAIEKMRAVCESIPDRPDQAESLLCGFPRETERLPIPLNPNTR